MHDTDADDRRTYSNFNEKYDVNCTLHMYMAFS